MTETLTGSRLAVTLAATLATTVAYHLSPPSALLWHGIFQHLFFLPIVLTALWSGLRGGLGAALLAGLLYLGPTTYAQTGLPADQLAEAVDFLVVGTVAGLFAGRERTRAGELRRAAAELNRVYQELQRSLEQIRRAERLSAVGELAAGLAHELRNPLASIAGAIGILRSPATPQDLRDEFFGIIDQECTRMGKLLTNLLAFARPREPEMRAVMVGGLLRHVAALVQHGAGQGRILVRIEDEPGLPALTCDPEQIEQVLLNLLLNAVQATPSAAGEVVLRAGVEQGSLRIDVVDQGCGVSAEQLARIFDPFFTTKKDGTGLGLAVAHRIVSQHGGMLEAARNPGRGMTFSVRLPFEPGGRAAGAGRG